MEVPDALGPCLSPFKTLEGKSGESKEESTDSWMGIYINGFKVGYSHSRESLLGKNRDRIKKSWSESLMRVSRLGGEPVEIATSQEAHFDGQGNLLEVNVRTKMSESETLIRAEISPGEIVFKSGKEIIKQLPYEGQFYLDVPIKSVLKQQDSVQEKTYSFRLLDFISYGLAESTLEVLGKEEVLVLGQKMALWHTRTQTAYAVPVTVEEWVDEEGRVWKSVMHAAFLTSTSIRMSKEKAVEVSKENFDIAYSSLISSNVSFDNARAVKSVTFKISGISPEMVKHFPLENGTQEILDVRDDGTLFRTSSVVFSEKSASLFPINGEEIQRYLRSTTFCQSEDPDIQAAAHAIVGKERNSWKAAKKIAEWVRKKMTSTYDVGFATAAEILKNPRGDCSEFTVLMVALCRAVGIPARAAVGVMYGRGIFAYHIWPEVYVGRWVGLDSRWLAVDQATGEYFTDATHIKFGQSALDENLFKEVTQAVSEIIGKIRLEVVDYSKEIP